MEVHDSISLIYAYAGISSVLAPGPTSYQYGTGRQGSSSVTRYVCQLNISFLFKYKSFALLCLSTKISEVRFSSFDFLDEHHILYSISKEDSIYVRDLRCHASDHHHRQQKT